MGHQGFGHRKSASAALLAFPVVLPPAAVGHRGAQVAIPAQRCLDDNTVGNLGAVTMFDRVLDELGHRVNYIGDVGGVGADLRQPLPKPGADLACGVKCRIQCHVQRW